MRTGVNAIDSDDEEENAKQEKKMKYKKLDMKKVNGVEDDPECGQMDEEGNMITGHGVEIFAFVELHLRGLLRDPTLNLRALFNQAKFQICLIAVTLKIVPTWIDRAEQPP